MKGFNQQKGTRKINALLIRTTKACMHVCTSLVSMQALPVLMLKLGGPGDEAMHVPNSNKHMMAVTDHYIGQLSLKSCHVSSIAYQTDIECAYYAMCEINVFN